MFSQAYSGATEVIALGIAPGEMLLETVEAAVKEHDIKYGAVV